MDKIIEQLKKFNKDRDWEKFHTPSNLAKSISIEAGELLETFQWSDEVNLEKIKEELADIYLYTLMLADKCNLDLNEIALTKISANEKKYPIEKSKGNSKKYTEFSDE